MPKNLRQGVDHLKAAGMVAVWDMEHLDWRNLVNRHSIIKRVCRLGSKEYNKVVEVVTLQQSFMEVLPSASAASTADRDRLGPLQSLRVCPLEDSDSESDRPA